MKNVTDSDVCIIINPILGNIISHPTLIGIIAIDFLRNFFCFIILMLLLFPFTYHTQIPWARVKTDYIEFKSIFVRKLI
jgi:hypothetical protein